MVRIDDPFVPTHTDVRLNVADVVRQPGVVVDVMGEFELDEVGTTLARVTGPIRARLRLEGVLEGVVAAGKISAQVQLSCRGCLEAQTETIDVEAVELFSTDPDIEVDDEVYSVHGLEIDVEQYLRDALLLALPESPLFCEDTIDSCPRYQKLLTEGHIEQSSKRGDPRWAPLNNLFPDDTREN